MTQLSCRSSQTRVREESNPLPIHVPQWFFNLLDGDRRLVDAEDAGRFAGCGADASGELREIIGGVQTPHRFFQRP